MTAQDAGKYTCTAANDVGVVTANAQLLVEGKIKSEKAANKKLFITKDHFPVDIFMQARRFREYKS